MDELRNHKKELKEKLNLITMIIGILKGTGANEITREKYFSKEKEIRDKLSEIYYMESRMKKSFEKGLCERYGKETVESLEDVLGEKYKDIIEDSFNVAFGKDSKQGFSESFKEEFKEIVQLVLKEIIKSALRVELNAKEILNVLEFSEEEIESLKEDPNQLT